MLNILPESGAASDNLAQIIFHNIVEWNSIFTNFLNHEKGK